MKLGLKRYKNRKGQERWSVSMLFSQITTWLDDLLASVPAEKNPFPDDETKGSSVEQVFALCWCMFHTDKLAKENMADWSAEKLEAYARKNFVKIAAEAQTQKEKTEQAVQLVSNEIVALTFKLIELKQDSPEWIVLKDQIEAYRSVETAAEEATE